MDEELKALIETNAAETRRHFDDVAERLRDDLRSEIASNAEGLRTDFDTVAKSLRYDLQIVAEATVANSHGIAALTGRFDSLDGKVEVLDAKVDGLSMKVDHLTMRVDHLEVEMKDGFAELHARVDRLESDLSPQ
ncbi:MAG TPA: hypothetical protein VMU84_13200 [Thermoanaerobaculia bacterium]|nr:hypothetical protein [Thermoanaerobaculia bacterium]